MISALISTSTNTLTRRCLACTLVMQASQGELKKSHELTSGRQDEPS